VPYDAAGPAPIGIENPTIIDIKTGKKTNTVPYQLMYPTGSSINFTPNLDIINITNGGRKPVGLYNLCKGVVLDPSFRTISKFSREGFAIAFTDTEYTFLDYEGKERLPKRVPHTLLRPNGNFKFSDDGIDPSLVLKNEYWPIKDANGKFGLFNLATQETTIPARYDSLDYQIRPVSLGFRYQDTAVATLAEKNGLFGVLDNENGNVIAPIVFKTPPKWERAAQGNYIHGSIAARNTTGEMENAYEVDKKSFVLPETIESSAISKFNDFWVVSQNFGPNNSEFQGIYNADTKRWVIKPEVNGFTRFYTGKNNTIEAKKKNGDEVVFDHDGRVLSGQP